MLLYCGKLMRKKNLRVLVEKKKIVEKTFADCSLVLPKDATCPNFAEKTFTKPQNPRKFSPSKVPRYTVPQRCMYVCSNYANQDQTEQSRVANVTTELEVYMRTR